MKMDINMKRTEDTEYILYCGTKYSTFFIHNFITRKHEIISLENNDKETKEMVNNFLSTL